MPLQEIITAAVAIVLALFVAFVAAAIVVAILNGKIDIKLLISEKSGEASMSRFQLLLFTFVVAVSLFLIVLQNGELPSIPSEVLTLLGISGGTYIVSKGIQQGPGKKPTPDAVTPPEAPEQ